MNKLSFFKRQSLLLLTLFAIIPFSSGLAEVQKIKTIAIIPFETNSQTDISYITSGILNMLHSRLAWKGNVAIIKPSIVMKEISSITESSESKAIIELGGKTNADYVITGIVTEFSGAYSIDTKVYDLKKKSYLTFYGQSRTLDKIISTFDIIAAKINKKVFNRTTSSYEKFEKDNIITEEELQRMNPERMMPIFNSLDAEEKPWWKIW